MKQILLSLLLFCSLGIVAQDVVVRRQKKQQTSSIDSKRKADQDATARMRAEAKRREQARQEQLRKEQQERERQARLEQQRREQLRREQEERERIEREKLNSPMIGTSTYVPIVQTFKVKKVSFQMVEVRGGTFHMGGTSEQGEDAFGGEKTVHQVTLSSYYIGKYEVTQELWQAVMGRSSNPSGFKGKKKPVDKVSWKICQEFISRLNTITGKHFRLPTEAEWEFASRGGIMSRGYKYSGSNTLSNVAWYIDNAGSTTHDVGTKSPNELGIFDMSGNVREYCSDWTGPYNNNSELNPKGADWGVEHVDRGGSWTCKASYCRVSSRFSFGLGTNSNLGNLGLRLALSE